MFYCFPDLQGAPHRKGSLLPSGVITRLVDVSRRNLCHRRLLFHYPYTQS